MAMTASGSTNSSRHHLAALHDVVASLKSWKQPAGSGNPFKLACRVDPGASVEEGSASTRRTSPPGDLEELWQATREAWLFEDVEHGQWGLHILNRAESAARTTSERADRPDDLREGDALGEFVGDAELLVFAPTEDDERRCLIALPLDGRADWYPAGASVAEFLDRYLVSNGDKFWERGKV